MFNGGHILKTHPGGVPYNASCGEALPKKNILFRLHVYKRVGIYWLKYMKNLENLSFRSVKRPEGLTREKRFFYWIKTAVKNAYKVPN